MAQQSHKGYRSYFTLVISVQLILAFICLSAKAVLAKIRSPVVLATLKLMVIHLGKVADASTHNKMDRVNLGLMFGQVQYLFSVTLACKVDFFSHRLCFGQTPRSTWAWNIFKVV